MAGLDLSGQAGNLSGSDESSDYEEVAGPVLDLTSDPHVGQTALGPSGLPAVNTGNIARVGLSGPLGLTLGVPLSSLAGGTPSGATTIL